MRMNAVVVSFSATSASLLFSPQPPLPLPSPQPQYPRPRLIHTPPPPSRTPIYIHTYTHLYALYQGRKTSLTTRNTPSSLKRSVSARTTGLEEAYERVEGFRGVCEAEEEEEQVQGRHKQVQNKQQ